MFYYNGDMSFWDNLLEFLGYRRVRHVTFQAENDLIESLSEMAVQERRPQEQVAADLLMQAVAQYKAAGTYWQDWETLSPREQQVAALICLNYTNRQAAARLGISEETVKTHMHHLLAKFGMHNRGELRQALAGWDFSAWEK
jgi:DNA-binding CsgD family transcriptional regulator